MTQQVIEGITIKAAGSVVLAVCYHLGCLLCLSMRTSQAETIAELECSRLAEPLSYLLS